jgi:hypothetical protein
MPASYPEAPRSHRPFIVTAYVVDSDGELEPQMPSSCPQGAQAGEGCQLSLHHWRRRKTGPRHPLAVIDCGTHGSPAFTLYPPGYGPYRRQPVERLSPDGRPIGIESDPDAATELAGTLFEAAADARAGRAWARDGDAGDRPPERWWSTQGRHLGLAARLVGVAAELTEKARERVAAALSVGTLGLREKAKARGYRAIGDAVCSVLAAVGRGPRRSRRLLLCGHLVGRWGEPMHWDARRGVLRRSPFRVSDQGAAP